MSKQRSRKRIKSGIKGMKLIAIKAECYAISGVATTKELKARYPTLCLKRDLRKRKNWEYVLKQVRENGDWIGIRVSDIENITEKIPTVRKSKLGLLTFHERRVEMDKAAENDD